MIKRVLKYGISSDTLSIKHQLTVELEFSDPIARSKAIEWLDNAVSEALSKGFNTNSIAIMGQRKSIDELAEEIESQAFSL